MTMYTATLAMMMYTVTLATLYTLALIIQTLYLNPLTN